MDISVAKKLFENVKGTGFAGIDSLTVVPLTGGKSNPQKGRVTKRTTGSTVMVFAQEEHTAYSAQVKRRMEKEGLDAASWEGGPLPYGEWVDDTMFIVHTKKGDTEPTHYLRVHFVNAGTSEYLLDGEVIAKEDVIGLPKPRESKQGGQSDKVIPRNYKLDSITAIRIDGTEYKV